MKWSFLPTLVLLAVAGIFGVDRALSGRPRWRLAVPLGLGSSAGVFRCCFNVLASLDRYAAQRYVLGASLDRSGPGF